MKITLNRRRSESGNLLLLTLATCVILGTSLAGYLGLVAHQNRSVMRSLAWNSALPVLEAGFEEALTHLQWHFTNGLAREGWTRQSGFQLTATSIPGNFFVKRVNLPDSYCVVGISDTVPPVLYSEGFVRLPLSTSYIPRAVRLDTRRDGIFSKGMVAKGRINLNGQNVKTDSFDSADPLRNNPLTAQGDAGDVASNAGIVGIIGVGNANIYGRAATGPGGTITVGPNGGVGSHVWQAGNRGIQPGWSSDDSNIQFPDVRDPFNSGYSTPAGNPLIIDSSGNWLISDLSRSLIVRSGVTAVLKVTDNINLTGNDAITLESGATLHLYMAGTSAKIAGNGVVNPGNAINFAYYGMPSNTSLDLGGNAAFTGVIYAPNAAFSLGGAGNDAIDFIGASVTSTVTMNGHFNFHYDENLGRIGPMRGFVVTAWNEI
jgi:hypothetical protein